MTYQRLKTQELQGETLHLVFIHDRWRLSIEPENRRNGTQSYDGWFPRYYSKASFAKAAVTRKFGRVWQWEKPY